MRIKRAVALLLILSLLVTAVPALAASANAKRVAKIAYSQLGKPYRISSNPPHSFNCASLVIYCYNKVKSGSMSSKGINVPYKKIRSKSKMAVGDIVCYKISSNMVPKIMNYHFGIYCGNGYFIHASRNSGRVICSKVNSFGGSFLGALRLC